MTLDSLRALLWEGFNVIMFVKGLARGGISKSVDQKDNVGLGKSNYGFNNYPLQEASLDRCSPLLVTSH